MKAKADADMAAARRARDKGPRLHGAAPEPQGRRRQARDRSRTTNPNTIDHDTAYGDMDHTEQVTDLKLTLKK